MAEIDMDAVIAELRKPDGWRKEGFGEWDESSGSVCLLGAVRRVSGVEHLIDAWKVDREADGLLTPIVEAHFPERLLGTELDVTSFNDHPDTTLDDVILVCEKARAEQ